MDVKVCVPGILLALFFVQLGYADTIGIVTGRGNVFMLEDDPGFVGSEGTGSGDGTSMLDGLGINSRIIHKEYGGSMIYGRNLVGTEESVRPYVEVDDSTRFMVSALYGDDPGIMPIPSFYHEYHHANGTLRQASAQSPNILGYDSVRRMSGDIDVSIYDGSGLVITGEGRAIIRLLDYTGQTLVMTGDVADGTIIRMANSPYDLIDMQHDTKRGFLIYDEPVNPDTGSGPPPEPPRWRNVNTPPTESRISVIVGNVDDSDKTGIFEYLQEASASWYHGKCCRGRYTTSGSAPQTVETSLVITGHPSGYLVIAGDRNDPSVMNIQEIARLGAKLSITHYNRVADYNYRIYDTLPVKEYRTMSGAFEEPVVIPGGSTYVIIDSAGGTSRLKGTALDGRDFLEIGGLEPNTGYKITKDRRTVSVGLTSDSGRIGIPAPADHRSPGIGGILYMYGDSLTYTRDADRFGTAVFDHVNGQIITLDTIHNRAYSVHAYVKIPVTGNVAITDANLDGRLNLDYLDGDYATGQNLYFPIIPTYKQVRLEINDIPTHLNIPDILGATGLKIADPVSSTITADDPSGFVHSVESTAGVITYVIATADGNAKAHVQATIYGASDITNTRTYELAPPPPPPPRPTDPLTTWIEVYVNGDLREIGGHTSTQIFFSDEPSEDHASGTTKTSAYHTARFSYPPVTATGTISVPVREGDFVEFYFYSRIHAEGSVPPVPTGYEEIKRSGSASATSVIEYASINTSL